MKVTQENTALIALYAGLSSREMSALEALINSVDKNFNSTLIVLDGSHDAHKRVQRDEPLWTQDRNFARTEDVELSVSPEDSDQLFERYSDVVERVEECVFPREAALDRTFYERIDEDFCLLMHSDVVFKNGDFFADATRLTGDLNPDEFGAMGLTTSMLPLGVDRALYGRRGDTIVKRFIAKVDRIRNWLIRKRHEGIQGQPKNYDEKGIRRKGQFPRITPYLILLNRKQYTANEMRWDPMYLDVDDYTMEPPTDWRIIGDSGASLLYQLAVNKLKLLNVDYTRWIEHEGGTWNPHLKRLNWYYIGRDYEGSEPEFWDERSIPDELQYQPPEN